MPRCPRLALAAITLAALTAPARADEPPLPPRVEEAARTAFAEAQAADQAGDLATAIERYRYVQKIAPHPSVTYNLADVLRRKHDVRGAARAYRDYLKQAPTAPDRAKVETILAQLEATPGEVDVTSKAADAVIFIDGVRQPGPAPIFVELPPGPHRFDALTPISFRSLVHDVDFARTQSVSLNPPPRVDGTVVVSGSGWLGRAKVLVDGEGSQRLGELLPIAPGKHALEVVAGDCRWTKAIAPPHGDVLYVYLDVAAPPKARPPAARPARPPGAKPAPPPKPTCGKARFTISRVRFPAP